MKCIDFDKEFERYLSAWMKQHNGEYRNYDELEARVPDIYAEWLAAPLSWLGNKCPGEYFEQFDNARMLVNHMEDHFKQRVPVPDMLMNRITELGDASEQPLYDMLTKERSPREARMLAITMLREIESEMPLSLYIDWVAAMVSAEDAPDAEAQNELAENALESLSSLGEKAVFAMKARLNDATDTGRAAFCSLLCHYPDEDETVFSTLMSLLQKPGFSKAELADYLGKLGNEKAVEPLKALAASVETSYLDYIELRGAIETLGGECPVREFDENDPQYEAMKVLEKQKTGKI